MQSKTGDQMLIAVVNQSTLVNNAEVQLMCQAIQIQLTRDVFPAWNIACGTVSFYPTASAVPAGAWTIFVIDNDTQVAGALGYHEETADKVVGYIMCQPILSNGGTVMNFNPANPGAYAVSSTLSHEIIEAVGDCFAGFWSDGTPIPQGTEYAMELCDPVENDSYPITVANGTVVAVSNFITPAWFDPQATSGKFDFLGKLTKPFSMDNGGYMIVRSDSNVQQVFAEGMPEWKKEARKSELSRSSARGVYTKTLWQRIKNWFNEAI
jgi:hypothetical protein